MGMPQQPFGAGPSSVYRVRSAGYGYGRTPDRVRGVVLQGLGGEGLSRPAAARLRRARVPGAALPVRGGEQLLLPAADRADERGMGAAYAGVVRVRGEGVGAVHARP